MTSSQRRPSGRERPSAAPQDAREGPDRTGVLGIQRSRMVAAAIAVVEAEGYSRLTIAKVTARSKVSHSTFYDVFLDCEDCFLAGFEQALSRAGDALRAAYSAEPDWREGMRAAALSLLTLMDREPGLARLCIVEALAAGPRVLDRRARAIQDLARILDTGRALADAHHEPQPLMAQAIVGGIAALLHTRLLREDAAPLTDLLGQLMGMIVMPYMGRAAAREELSAPDPRSPREKLPAAARGGVDPLRKLDIRLTYRTVRVLSAIAESPDASNRQIAQDAGIVDQGQISKLLARLAGVGLIENASALRGANAWRLTAFGEQVQRATRTYR